MNNLAEMIGKRPWVGYACAVSLTGLTLLVRWALSPVLGDNPALVLFAIPILLSAALGGLGPGLLATALIGVGVLLLPVPPYFLPGPAPLGAWLHWQILMLTGVLISLVSRTLRQAAQAREQSRRLWREASAATVLREREERLRLAISAARAMVYDHSPAHGVHFSEGLEDLLGYRSDEVEPNLDWWFAQVHPDDPHTREEVLGVVNVRDSYAVEYRVRHKDGHYIHVQDMGRVVMRDAAGRPTRIVGSISDITERKQAEQDLQESRRQLAQMNLDLERRVAEKTAEVRARARQLQALAVQLNRVEYLERRRLAKVLHDGLQQLLVGAKFNLSIVQARLTDDLAKEAARQVDILLDQSVSASRSLTAELCPPVLHKGSFAAALRWLADWMHTNHGLEAQVLADEQVNPPREEIRVLLFESVRELLFNVVKHAHPLRALLRMERDQAGCLRITVTDEGPGFDPLRSHSSSNGTGLGLFAIQERLESLGGRLQIDSAPGRPTCVTLILSCLPPAASTPSQDAPALTSDVSTPTSDTQPPTGLFQRYRLPNHDPADLRLTR